MEAAAAGIATGSVLGLRREEGYHCQVVVGALAYALVCAQCPFIELGGEGLAPLHKLLLLGCGGFHDGGKFLSLCLKIGFAYCDVIRYALQVRAAGLDSLAGLAYVLLGDITEKALILKLLIY